MERLTMLLGFDSSQFAVKEPESNFKLHLFAPDSRRRERARMRCTGTGGMRVESCSDHEELAVTAVEIRVYIHRNQGSRRLSKPSSFSPFPHCWPVSLPPSPLPSHPNASTMLASFILSTVFVFVLSLGVVTSSPREMMRPSHLARLMARGPQRLAYPVENQVKSISFTTTSDLSSYLLADDATLSRREISSLDRPNEVEKPAVSQRRSRPFRRRKLRRKPPMLLWRLWLILSSLSLYSVLILLSLLSVLVSLRTKVELIRGSSGGCPRRCSRRHC